MVYIPYIYDIYLYSPALCWTIIWTIRPISRRLIVLIVLIGARPIINDKPIRKHSYLKHLVVHQKK